MYNFAYSKYNIIYKTYIFAYPCYKNGLKSCIFVPSFLLLRNEIVKSVSCRYHTYIPTVSKL